MHLMQPAQNALEDADAMRRADRELLSLALMHARNRTLAWLSLLDRLPSACRLAGHVAWWQERWIARNVQRSRGAAADATRAPLASIEPQADAWWAQPGGDSGPTPDALRAYLAETLEVTLDLLAAADDSDEALHWYRAALFEEDAAAHRRSPPAARAHGPQRARAALVSGATLDARLGTRRLRSGGRTVGA
jgi:gamma-glutamyl hercynylcysteine S-oxide synthase